MDQDNIESYDSIESDDDSVEILWPDETLPLIPLQYKTLVPATDGLENHEEREPFIVCMQTTEGRRFQKFDSIEKLEAYHHSLPEEARSMYEVYCDNWPLKMCIDYDCFLRDNEAIHDEDFAQLLCEWIIEPINATIDRLYGLVEWPVKTEHWMIALSSGWCNKRGAWKMSAHLILHQWAFPNLQHIHHVVTQTLPYMPKTARESIDFSVFKGAHKQMRLVDHHAMGSSRVLRIWNELGGTWAQSVLSNVQGCRCLPWLWSETRESKKGQSKNSINSITLQIDC
jgi:hypothetical protein